MEVSYEREAQVSLWKKEVRLSREESVYHLGLETLRLPRFPFLSVETGQEAAHEDPTSPTQVDCI